MEEWLTRLSRYDFVYGSRFHGNMAAIQVGVSALNMPFDTRTREMCEYLNLPMLPLLEFHAGMPVEELRQMADFTLFSQTYPAKLQNYRSFLERNGLCHALGNPPNRVSVNEETTRIKAATVWQLVHDFLKTGNHDTRLLLPAITQRLRSDRGATSREAAEVGRLTDIETK